MALRYEGFAIVSADGMVAGADGLMPNSLKFERDQDLLDRALDSAALLVHGRLSHEAQANSHKRRRLLLTRSGGPFSTTPIAPNTWLWSPQATPFSSVCEALGIDEGMVAVIGGTAAYDMFLPVYDAFHLCRAQKVRLPGGVPVFGAAREGNPPETVLTGAGLLRAEDNLLEPEHGVRHELWRRA